MQFGLSPLLLGIFYHATISFFPGFAFWPIMDTHRSLGLADAGYVSHMFRMTTFFLLAGFFGHMVCKTYRHGCICKTAGQTYRHTVSCWLACSVYGFYRCGLSGLPMCKMVAASLENPPSQPPMTWKNFPLTHLWFLYVLAIFYVIMLGFRAPYRDD